MKVSKKELFNIPNILTYIRLICVPAFILAFFLIPNTSFVNVYVALAIFFFASLTDIVDGKIARKYNLTSDLGIVLDPLADKLLQVSVIICLTVVGYIHWIIPVLIAAKELYMIVGGIFLAGKNIVGKANFYGKAAAFIFAVAILMAFFNGADGVIATYRGAQAGTIFAIGMYTIFGIGLVFSYIAAAVYTKIMLEQIGGIKNLRNSKDIHVDYSINKKDSDKDTE